MCFAIRYFMWLQLKYFIPYYYKKDKMQIYEYLEPITKQNDKRNLRGCLPEQYNQEKYSFISIICIETSQ